MGANCGFTRSSCGYVGTSDGFQDLCLDMKMTWQFGQALNGNIAIMGEIDVARHREFTIAIAFGDGHHAAIAQHDADPRDAVSRAPAPLSGAVGTRRLAPNAGLRLHRRRHADAHQP